MFSIKNTTTVAIWLLFLLTAVPIGILAFFNHPSVADDYCFAYMTRDYGFWESQKIYYEGWSGRYISNMIFHATPLAFGAFWFVKVMPFLILGLLFHAIYCFVAELINTTKTISLTITAAFLSLYISQSASIVDNFYWYTSVFIFPISVCYWFYLVVVLLRYYQPQYQAIKIPIAFLAATLAFFIVGSNEVMMLLVLGFLGSTFGYLLLFKKRFEPLLLILTLFALGCAYFLVVKAPGNQIRMQGDVLSGGFGVAFIKALKSLAKNGFKWVFSSPLLPFSVAYALAFKQFLPSKNAFIFKVNPFITLLAFAVLLTMMLFVIHYGNNDGVPERVENAIYALFLAGWFYHLTMLLSNINLDKFMIANYLQSAKGYLLLASILFVTVVTFTKAKNIKVMYNDIFRGTAYRYDQEMQQRYQKISTSTSDTVYVAPLKNIPLSLNFDEIKDTEKHLWNKCYATYFEKKVIILKE